MFYYRSQYHQMLKQAEERQAVIYRLSQQIQAVSDLDAKHTEELTNAKAEIDKLHDAVRAGTKRLRVKAVCHESNATTAKSRHDEATTQLSEAARPDYFRLREMMIDNEKQTEYLQQYIKVIIKK
ncbi:lysis protein (plasmid) [Arsenophonus nasoniae]|uniref:Lysis protein n=2 Tax=Arsenophonus nasoniae TaxID=638 RepID=A0AA95K865_9GAMM|nr:lysis protein [Arsenophonus nasoniae]